MTGQVTDMETIARIGSWIREAVAKERERCAKIVETYAPDNVATFNLAMMIRNPPDGSGSGPEEAK